MLPGSPWPSMAKKTPPTTPSTLSSGCRSAASGAEMVSISTPKARAMDALRRNSSMRSSVRATVMDPLRLKPVATPVSASSAP